MSRSRTPPRGFLDRWSERKRADAGSPAPIAPDETGEMPTHPPASAAPDGGAVPDAGAEGRTDAEILEELGLPDPEALVKGDDFSAFMKSGVPARLRNRALRRLWVSDPTLAAVDGLVDYGEDFTDAALVVENMATLYQVGKGMVQPEPDPVEEAEAEPEAGVEDMEAEEATSESDPPESDEVADATEAEESPPGEDAETADTLAVAQQDPVAMPAPRRMRFRVPGQ